MKYRWLINWLLIVYIPLDNTSLCYALMDFDQRGVFILAQLQYAGRPGSSFRWHTFEITAQIMASIVYYCKV